MAIVSRLSVTKAASIKKAVKSGLTQRLRQRVGLDTSSEEETDEEDENETEGTKEVEDWERDVHAIAEMKEEKGTDVVDLDSPDSGDAIPRNGHTVEGQNIRGRRTSRRGSARQVDLEMGVINGKDGKDKPRKASSILNGRALEQSMPADAVLNKAGAEEVCIC